MPTLIIHGDDDQIVPIDASARLTAQIVQGAELKVYPGASHGLFATHTEQFNADLLDFIKREPLVRRPHRTARRPPDDLQLDRQEAGSDRASIRSTTIAGTS